MLSRASSSAMSRFGLAVGRDRVVLLIAVEEAEADGGAEEAAHFVIDDGLRHFAGLHRGQQCLLVHEVGVGHFKIEAAVGCGYTVVGRPPVGHEDAVETPLMLEDLDVEVGVLRGVLAIDEVVRVHDRAGAAFFHGGFEGRQIDLAERTLVHIGADTVAIVLLVIRGEVFDGGHHAAALQPANEAYRHAAREEGIFAVVLEVAAGHRRAIDVDGGAEENMHAACAGVVADGDADFVREIGVPCGGHANARRICGNGTPEARADGAVGHFEAREMTAGSAREKTLSTPARSLIFCSSVSFLTMASARCSMAGLSGTGACACVAAVKIRANEVSRRPHRYVCIVQLSLRKRNVLSGDARLRHRQRFCALGDGDDVARAETF